MRFACWALLAATVPAGGQVYGPPPLLRKVGVEQKMGAQVRLDVPFADETGQPVTLRRYTGSRPVILALVYYQCPSLCNLILNGVLTSVKGLKLEAGRDFEVVAVSFDPRDTPELAARKKATYLSKLGRADGQSGWHFLTGSETSSRAVAESVGFRFAYDPLTNQYAHPSAIMLLTPEGRVARYFYGINYPARDMRLGLVEASNNRIGTPIDQVLLFCYHYDPANGKYGLVIINVLRAAGLATVAALAAFVALALRQERA
jgi:protein SCO1